MKLMNPNPFEFPEEDDLIPDEIPIGASEAKKRNKKKNAYRI